MKGYGENRQQVIEEQTGWTMIEQRQSAPRKLKACES
jgi:hypothetical protein